MWKFCHQLLLWQERQCKQLGLTRMQTTVLVMIVEKLRISQYDLAQELWVSNGTVSKAVDALLDKGYITRRKVWKGRISYQLQPTHRGYYLYEQLQRLQKEMMKELTHDALFCELANLDACFGEMKRNMDRLSSFDFKPQKPYQMEDFEVITREKWEAMKAVDIRTVDKNQLVDIQSVVIDSSLPIEAQMASFLRQIKNPFCFKVGDVAVRISPETSERLYRIFFGSLISDE